MLLASLGKKKLLGLEAAFQVLNLINCLLIFFPALFTKWKSPQLNPVYIVCWGTVLVMSLALMYIDKTVPKRSFRKSNKGIRVVSAIVLFWVLTSTQWSEWGTLDAVERFIVFVEMLVGTAVVAFTVDFGTTWCEKNK